MTVKELRFIPRERLRRLCNECGWYTKGSPRDFEMLLVKVGARRCLAADDMLAIARDIFAHSGFADTEETRVVSVILMYLSRLLYTTFVVVDGLEGETTHESE